MRILWIVASALGLVGFGIEAATSRCKREQGDSMGTTTSAQWAVIWLLVALLCGVLAVWG